MFVARDRKIMRKWRSAATPNNCYHQDGGRVLVGIREDTGEVDGRCEFARNARKAFVDRQVAQYSSRAMAKSAVSGPCSDRGNKAATVMDLEHEKAVWEVLSSIGGASDEFEPNPDVRRAGSCATLWA